MLTGVPKYAGQAVRQRASSPQLQVLNTALMTAIEGLSPEAARADRSFHGRLVESVVGAHLANDAQRGDCELRSEEHTPELQSLMRISYAAFCLTKNTEFQT